jgi:hypothetical protein
MLAPARAFPVLFFTTPVILLVVTWLIARKGNASMAIIKGNSFLNCICVVLQGKENE